VKSSQDTVYFDRFTLNPAARQLLDDGEPVALSGRYLDALILLAREPQTVVTKQRLHEQVWKGVPVTDEALTQCVRALRKALGDDAAAPRFIETVPKHGYRFIAPVETDHLSSPVRGDGRLARAGAMTLGGAAAGGVVGLLYGLANAGGEGSSLSLLIVVICVAALAAGLSAMGISLGIALIAARRRDAWRTILGGALGGFLTGGLANLLGRDAFRLLFGQVPESMTGAMEGLLLGLVCAIGIVLLERRGPKAGSVGVAGLGAIAGAVIIFADGAMLGGSLAALAESFPASQLSLPAAGTDGGSPLAVASGALEGVLFAAGLVLGAVWYGRRLRR
jgi:DNA-binding winged helix-turn-helix (wHTH) protein